MTTRKLVLDKIGKGLRQIGERQLLHGHRASKFITCCMVVYNFTHICNSFIFGLFLKTGLDVNDCVRIEIVTTKQGVEISESKFSVAQQTNALDMSSWVKNEVICFSPICTKLFLCWFYISIMISVSNLKTKLLPNIIKFFWLLRKLMFYPKI